MIGGTVVQVIALADKVWVNCEEDHTLSRCAIYVERNEQSMKIKPSDSVWWQGGYAMWTPYFNRGSTRGENASPQRGGVDYDIRIPRIGFSGVSKPT